MKMLSFLFIFVWGCSHNIKIQGHRGARAVRAENTIEGFQYALKQKVDVLELDLGVTKDDILVIAHDAYLNPDVCTKMNGDELTKKVMLRSIQSSDLKNYNCAGKVNPRFPGQKLSSPQKMPTLREFFTWLTTHKDPHAHKVLLNIETKLKPGKEDQSLPPKKFAQKLIDIIDEFEIEDRVVIQSFDFRTLREARKLNNDIQLSALVARPITVKQVQKIIDHYDIAILSPNYKWLTKNFVSQVKSMGVEVVPWTVNQRKDWQRMVDIGIREIITDDPAGLRAFLRE